MTTRRSTRLNWNVIHYDEVESTMDVAADLARDSTPAGTIVIAEHQTRGRGQRGRVWLEPPGTCLLMTIILRPPFRIATDPRLSRRIAEAVGRAVKRLTGLTPAIKEPNDVLIGSRKVCGILCQSSLRGEVVEYLLVGIGLNVNLEASDLPLETATSLLVETGQVFDRDLILQGILDELQSVPELCDSVFD